MRTMILAVTSIVAFPALAAEQTPMLSFNGVRLGDTVDRVKESKRSGQCEGGKRTLTECTLIDRAGIAYDINDGHVVRIEANKSVSPNAKLPFGLRLGMNTDEALRRSFPKDGGQAFVKPETSGMTLIRMIREPKTDYEFELQMHFGGGKLERVVYKDVI